MGLVELPSSGVVQGHVVNTEKAYRTLREVLQLLERQVQMPIHEIILVYSGVTLGCHNSWGITGTTPIGNSHDSRDNSSRYVSEEDLERALGSASQIAISRDLERLHEIPRCYKLDGKIVRSDIIGSNGIRLEVEVHIITCLLEATKNLIKISSIDYRPTEIVHSSIAASYIGLTQDELEQGSLLIDMGYGSTSFQYSFEGQPLITESVGLGGYHITCDIAEVFGISFDVSEELKLERGVCWPPFVSQDAQVVIPGGPTSVARQITLSELCEVLNARIEEIFEIIYGRLQYYGIDREYIRSVVLVGGSALLSGIGELAEEVFESPARLGLPDEPLLVATAAVSQIGNWQSPQYTALLGLALFCLEADTGEEPGKLMMPKHETPKNTIWELLFDWVRRKFG